MVAERHQQQQSPGKVAAFNLAEAGFGDRPDLDDDGRERRTGNAASSTIPPAACAVHASICARAPSSERGMPDELNQP